MYVRTYLAEYHSRASRELQSARRHTLNTIPGAPLNAARAFISCVERMDEHEGARERFAEVSTCSSVMKPDQNNNVQQLTLRTDIKARRELRISRSIISSLPGLRDLARCFRPSEIILIRFAGNIRVISFG